MMRAAVGWMRSVLPPGWVLAAYLAALAVTFLAIGLDATFYAVAFGLGLGVRLAEHPLMVLGVMVILYPLDYLGIRRSLARFPWPELTQWDQFWSAFSKPTASRRTQLLGWPFDRMQPQRPEAVSGLHPGPLTALLLSLLAGWYLYAASCLAPPDDNPAAPAYWCACLLAVGGRLLLYLWYHRPPISLIGRIFTLRWIVPGFDQALAAPLLAGVLVIVMPWGLDALELSMSVGLGLSLSVVLFVLLAAPPSLARWHLTGSHRIAPGPPNPQELERI